MERKGSGWKKAEEVAKLVAFVDGKKATWIKSVRETEKKALVREGLRIQ